MAPVPAESVATPAAEPVAPEAAPSGGGWRGAAFNVGFIGFQFLAAYLHSRSASDRVREQAAEQGWVPPGTPSDEGLLYNFGSWLIDPMNFADRAVRPRDRINIPVWRAQIRERASAKAIGETLKIEWQVGQCRFDDFGSQIMKERRVVYRKQPDGTFAVQSGNAEGVIDLNSIISVSVSDSVLEAQIFEDPCRA